MSAIEKSQMSEMTTIDEVAPALLLFQNLSEQRMAMSSESFLQERLVRHWTRTDHHADSSPSVKSYDDMPSSSTGG
jgi:hypothetical protein